MATEAKELATAILERLKASGPMKRRHVYDDLRRMIGKEVKPWKEPDFDEAWSQLAAHGDIEQESEFWGVSLRIQLKDAS